MEIKGLKIAFLGDSITEGCWRVAFNVRRVFNSTSHFFSYNLGSVDID